MNIIPQKLFEFPQRTLEEVEIYHDESYSRDNYHFYHQFLIIPVRSRDILNQALQDKRAKFKAESYTINWKEFRRGTGSRNSTAEQWLSLLNIGMSNNPFAYVSNGVPIIYKEYLGIKIGTFAGDLSESFWSHIPSEEERTRRKYETLLRMGIKGCLHYCFNPEFTCHSKIKISRFCTDAKVFGEVPLSNERILGRLESEVRDYIEVKDGLKIENIEKSMTKSPEVNFEELTDIVLGSTKYICDDCEKKESLDKITNPLAVVYQKKERGKDFQNSSHFRSFTIGVCEIDRQENLVFKDWAIPEIKTTDTSCNGILNFN